MEKKDYILTNHRLMYKNTLLILIFSVITNFAFCQNDSISRTSQNLFNYENSKKYAQYLEISGQYLSASNEYQRILLMQPNDVKVLNSLNYCFIMLKQPQKGINTLNILYPDYSLMPKQTKTEFAKLQLLDENYEMALNFSKTNITNKKDQDYIYLYSLIFTSQWDEASIFYSSINQKSLSNEIRIIDKGFHLKQKSPFLAGFMSSIVPGSGKIYTKKWKDGLISTIIIGGLAWQAYRSFSKKGVSSAYGWATASIGFGFYLGNIYGSVKSAKKYNKQKNNQLIYEAKDIFISDF